MHCTRLKNALANCNLSIIVAFNSKLELGSKLNACVKYMNCINIRKLVSGYHLKPENIEMNRVSCWWSVIIEETRPKKREMQQELRV